jgi:hypothetical protein
MLLNKPKKKGNSYPSFKPNIPQFCYYTYSNNIKRKEHEVPSYVILSHSPVSSSLLDSNISLALLFTQLKTHVLPIKQNTASHNYTKQKAK